MPGRVGEAFVLRVGDLGFVHRERLALDDAARALILLTLVVSEDEMAWRYLDKGVARDRRTRGDAGNRN